MKQAYDINPSVGGPILRDKLWFYTSARWQTNQNYIAGLYDNKNEGDPTKWTVRGGHRAAAASSRSSRTASTLRLTWQVAQKHKVSFYYDNQSRDLGRHARGRVARVGRGLSASRSSAWRRPRGRRR